MRKKKMNNPIPNPPKGRKIVTSLVPGTMAFGSKALFLISLQCARLSTIEGFVLQRPRPAYGSAQTTGTPRPTNSNFPLKNVYDDWRSDAVVDTMVLDEENIKMCLEEFIDSDYGKTMFGKHDVPAQYEITGEIEFVELCGPEVSLRLRGAFWHRRDTVLGRAAMWLNARMPEITDVYVDDPEDIKDFEDVIDEFSGEVLYQNDKRAPDFNGDRATMEYQGIDPDMRGPFPSGVGGLRAGGSMINPA